MDQTDVAAEVADIRASLAELLERYLRLMQVAEPGMLLEREIGEVKALDARLAAFAASLDAEGESGTA